MNVIEAITSRHSARAFLSKPVERDKLDAVLAAAVRSPLGRIHNRGRYS